MAHPVVITCSIAMHSQGLSIGGGTQEPVKNSQNDFFLVRKYEEALFAAKQSLIPSVLDLCRAQLQLSATPRDGRVEAFCMTSMNGSKGFKMSWISERHGS